ncbi:hypothetical protein [Mucilaginibacter sp. L196]|uniref:hypothetical protein n=1 Tax=Mucilaginibacter sp. L196 TaxID=1641870 RepID=UPI00131C886F|nr:hypothetical protein [Mucilaginibacter sp. L196]
MAILSTNCRRNFAHTDTLVEKLKKDKFAHAYLKSRTLFALKIMSNRYNINDATNAKLHASLPHAKNANEIIACLRSAGITHPIEYFGTPRLIAIYQSILKKDYPQLYQMSSNERESIFDQVASVSDTEKITSELSAKFALQRKKQL